MKKVGIYIATLLLSTSSLFVLCVGHAAASTSIWDGGGSDTKLSTDNNWSGDVAPVAGDDLVFPAGVSKKTIINDFTAGTSFGSITFSGATTNGEANYSFSGNSMTISNGLSVSFTGSGGAPTLNLPLSFGTMSVTSATSDSVILSGTVNIGSSTTTFTGAGTNDITGVLSGSGLVVKAGTGSLIVRGANSSYSGGFTINAGVLSARDTQALGTAAGSTTVNSGGQLYILVPQAQKSGTIVEPLVLNHETYDSGSGDPLGIVSVNASCGLSPCNDGNITLSGAITLGSDVRFDSDQTVTLTGGISGAHKLQLSDGQYGSLVINSSGNGSSTANGTYAAPLVTKTYSGNLPSQTISVNKNITAIVTGTYGTVFVNQYGTLKGTGTIGNLFMVAGGIVAPGASPGILNTGNVAFTGGTLQEELGGTTSGQYDQLNVTGTVDLGTTTTLSTSLYNGYSPAVGSSYTIINNDGNDAVTGTFSGLAEGTTFTVGSHLFKISYVGGDGNDVVLSVLPTPATPDTGFQLLHSGALMAIIVLCGVTPVLALAARRTAKSTR